MRVSKKRSTVHKTRKEPAQASPCAEDPRRELVAARLEAQAARLSVEQAARARAELERGYQRLERLYQIGKLLAGYDGESVVAALFAELAQALPLRSMVLVLAPLVEGEPPRLLSSCARGLPESSQELAEERALEALAVSGAAPPLAPAARLRLPALDVAFVPSSRGESDNEGATFGLQIERGPALGFLHVEAAGPLGEPELLFLRAVADQLAFAQGRHAARVIDVQLRERAEALDRRQRDLLAIVSHDLRNPLAAVLLGVSTLLRRSDMPAKLRLEHLEVMHRAASRANRLVHDLLDAGRIDAGHLVLCPEPLSLPQLFDEAVLLLGPLSTEREVRCEATVGEAVPPVLADRERVLQVLSNLVGNAIKFSQPGGAVELSAEPAGHEVRCAVQDSGPGIDPADLPHLFERYWQGAHKEGADRAGAGLGLAIAKGIVEAHGGRIWVETSSGPGSRFVFTLPAAG